MHTVKVLLTAGVAGLLALALFAPAAFAQEAPATGTLTGVVTWGTDANPAAFAMVRVEGTDFTARTDAGGRFVITGVPVGQTFTIDAYSDPMSPVASWYNVPVEAGQTVDIGMLNLGGNPQPAVPPPDVVTPNLDSANMG
jgi:hypothetical protein